MRVKLSSLQPSQLLPNFKTGQQRLPVPGSVTQQRAIQRSSTPDSDVLGSPSNPISIPDSPPNNGNSNRPMSPNGNERTSNRNIQQSQLPQTSSDIFKIPIPPRNPIQEKMVSDTVFKVPFPPGSNKAPSYGPVLAFSGGMVSPMRQNFQQPSSPLVPTLPAQRFVGTSQSELHRPIQDATRSSYNNPSMNPVINREPRPPSPLSPVDLFRDFGASSPDIQIIKDNRPLPPFKSIKNRPPGGTYISVTLPDGSIGYKIDTEGMNPVPYSFSNSPITRNEGLPYNSNFQPLRAPFQVNIPLPSSSSSTRILPKPTLSQPSPFPNLRPQISPQVNLPQQTPTQPSVPGNARIRPSGVDPAANSKSQSIQGLWPNIQLERGGPFYTNRQFQMASQQPIMPIQSINSAADAEQPRSLRPPQLPMDINRPNIGQTRPYAESSRPQLNPNNMGLRSYLSSPPLSALKTRQQPVRISPATDNINNYRNSLTEKQLIFPQPAAASPAFRFNNQNQIPPYGPIPQNAMAQSPQNILPKGPLLQKTNPETARTPSYFIQQSVPGYAAPQPRSPSPYTSLQVQQPNRIPEIQPLLQGPQADRIPTTIPGTQQNKIPTLYTSSQRLQPNRNPETFIPFQGSQPEKNPTLYTSSPGLPPNRLPEAYTTPQRSLPNRFPETYASPQRPQPNWPSEAYALSQGHQSSRIPEAYSSLQGQPERIPTPFSPLQGTQPNRISDAYPSLQGPQPERIPTPFAPLQGNQPNRISDAYPSLQGPRPERIPTPYASQGPQNKIPTPYLLQDSQPNRVPERSPSARLPSQTPGFTHFPFFQMPQANSPNLRKENDQYVPSKRGRFIGQSNPSQEGLQQLYRQPEYAQEYFKRLHQSPFQGQFSRNDQVNYQNSNPYQSSFTQQKGRSKTTQKERTQSQIQQMDIQKRFQEIHDAEYRDVGKFQQIPSRGNQAGGQYQQLQSANPPRQLPFQQGFSNSYGIQGTLLGDASSRSRQSSPFTPEPFGYRGQHFSYGHNPQRGLVQGVPSCSHSQTPQYPTQEGSGLRTYANDGQNGPIKAITQQRTSPASPSSNTAFNDKPTVESLAPNSNLYTSNSKVTDNGLQQQIRQLSQFPSASSNDIQRGPNTRANHVDSKTVEPFNDSTSGTKFLSQPILPNDIRNTSNNRVTEFANVNTDAQSRVNAGTNEIPTSHLPHIETSKESQDASSKSTTQATASVLPQHRGEMPFYTQSEVDSHHRRLLENNKTKEDTEFESDSTILQWYLQRAKQVLRHNNDNVNAGAQESLDTKKDSNDASASTANDNPDSNGNTSLVPHAATTTATNHDSNAKLSPLPRTTSTNSNSTNGTGELGQHSGGQASTTATSAADNSRSLSQPSDTLSANVLQQSTEISKQTSDNLTRKQRSASFEDLFDFLIESGAVNVS